MFSINRRIKREKREKDVSREIDTYWLISALRKLPISSESSSFFSVCVHLFAFHGVRAACVIPSVHSPGRWEGMNVVAVATANYGADIFIPALELL
jgi:hypothetical protein